MQPHPLPKRAQISNLRFHHTFNGARHLYTATRSTSLRLKNSRAITRQGDGLVESLGQQQGRWSTKNSPRCTGLLLLGELLHRNWISWSSLLVLLQRLFSSNSNSNLYCIFCVGDCEMADRDHVQSTGI